jgi:hypothetical protein
MTEPGGGINSSGINSDGINSDGIHNEGIYNDGIHNDGIDWLRSVETVVADEPVAGRGRFDFLLGAALAGVNLFVSAGIIAAWVLKTAGIVAVLVLHDTASTDNPAALAFVITGSLFGLALGAGGFAFFARQGWTSSYWPLFGITIALGSSVIAGRS